MKPEERRLEPYLHVGTLAAGERARRLSGRSKRIRIVDEGPYIEGGHQRIDRQSCSGFVGCETTGRRELVAGQKGECRTVQVTQRRVLVAVADCQRKAEGITRPEGGRRCDIDPKTL